MKWKTHKPPLEPVHGQIRYCMRFAWLPEEAEDGYTYWLEVVYVKESYILNGRGGRSFWYIAKWIGEANHASKQLE